MPKTTLNSIPEQALSEFLTSLEKRIENKGYHECCRCVLAFLVEGGFISASKIRAYMVMKVLYPKALQETPNKTQAIKKVARQLDISDTQVHNIVSNWGRY